MKLFSCETNDAVIFSFGIYVMPIIKWRYFLLDIANENGMFDEIMWLIGLIMAVHAWSPFISKTSGSTNSMLLRVYNNDKQIKKV